MVTIKHTINIESNSFRLDSLYKRGMRFVGSVIIYSYLQAVGIINSHEDDCFKLMYNSGHDKDYSE